MSVDSFRFLVVAALADGQLDDAEKPVLLQAAAHFGLSRQQAGEVVREIMAGGPSLAKLPEDTAARGQVFEKMVEIVAADGSIDPREMVLFERLAPHFGLTPAQATETLSVVRELLDEKTRQQ
ncbi:MAG: TerB family tellurite resistance protein [Planctomycetes bacterium]|nr:TerB family tellurite resistance protein [Planctomycetota bacterium]